MGKVMDGVEERVDKGGVGQTKGGDREGKVRIVMETF